MNPNNYASLEASNRLVKAGVVLVTEGGVMRHYWNYDSTRAYDEGKRDEDYGRRNYDYDKYSGRERDQAYFDGRADRERENRDRREEERRQEEMEERRTYERHQEQEREREAYEYEQYQEQQEPEPGQEPHEG